MRIRAMWNGAVLAESGDTIVVEGNHYFPQESLVEEYFLPSGHRTVCFWKGVASYRSVVVDGLVNRDAAWEYQHPSLPARKVKGRVAFWRGVEVSTIEESDERAVTP